MAVMHEKAVLSCFSGDFAVMSELLETMEYICRDCPRKCGVLRNTENKSGYCRSYSLPSVVRAAPHFGEEPCISGTRGSGAVFFSGCNLGCVYCQNREISRKACGKILGPEELGDVILRLADTGVHNINLVTATHFTRMVAKTLEKISLSIPVVWNSSGYENAETLRMLDGLVQIYMPDIKYLRSDLALRYSAAKDYPETAKNALSEMFRQTGRYVLDENGLMKRGLLIRHLILPGAELNTMDVIDYVSESFPEDSVIFSLMSQYTPIPGLSGFPELEAGIDAELNDRMCSYLRKSSITAGYWQEISSATEELLPSFDLTGV